MALHQYYSGCGGSGEGKTGRIHRSAYHLNVMTNIFTTIYIHPLIMDKGAVSFLYMIIVAKVAYAVWKNIVNGWQLWYKEKHGKLKWLVTLYNTVTSIVH